MSIPPITINYPLTTFHFDDPSANYAEIAPLLIEVKDDTNTTRITGTQFYVENNVNNTLNAKLEIATLTLGNGNYNALASASDGIGLYDASTGGYTQLKRGQLKTDGPVPVFDMSFNALSFRNVASAGAGEVIKSDASGAPYWATESLSDVIAVSADANQADITNVKSIQFTNVSDNKSVILTTINVSDNLETLNISTSPDFSGSRKEFTRAYLPLGIGGVIYYLPLYTTPI